VICLSKACSGVGTRSRPQTLVKVGRWFRYALRTPCRAGTAHIVLEPLERMARLAALLPPPRMHLRRYHGVFAIQIDTCARCQGRLGVIASIEEPEVIARTQPHWDRDCGGLAPIAAGPPPQQGTVLGNGGRQGRRHRIEKQTRRRRHGSGADPLASGEERADLKRGWEGPAVRPDRVGSRVDQGVAEAAFGTH